MATQIMPISQLVMDERIYPREETDQLIAYQYAESMEAGAKFPPIAVAKVEGKWMVVDGWHRIVAYKKRGETHVECEVLPEMTIKEAFIESIRRNISHGKRIERFEKKKIALRLQEMDIDSAEIGDILSLPISQVDSFRINPPIAKIDTIAIGKPVSDGINELDDGKEINIKAKGKKSKTIKLADDMKLKLTVYVKKLPSYAIRKNIKTIKTEIGNILKGVADEEDKN